MGNWRHRSVWWSRLAGLLAALGLSLTLTGVPASAAPPNLALDRYADAPLIALDPAAIAAQVGPQVVNINTRFGYNSAVGAGTGIVIDPNGVVLTNNHVISAATDISAYDVGNGQTYAVDVVGYSRKADVAVLQLRDAAGLPTATIGGGVAVGEPVVALGNTHGQGGAPSVIPGRVVALNQTVSANDTLTGANETLGGLIQAETAIKPGDSGGPLVNMAGQVVGVDTAATDSYKMSGGQGFAIPIGRAMAVANQIRAGASSNTVHIGPTAFLGLGVAENGGTGARVQRIVDGGPAAGSGIAPGDVITTVDNVPISGPTAMTDVMVPHHPGDVITLHWESGQGGQRSAPVTLGDGPPA
ncbi:S1C family serine protease [Mycobacterium tilburgii]|uniref:S1C family serine protease n=1 Tax=Mycobacterium tilburgii TaxID=44467 RepID=UPI0011842D75|nr:S1C family serine protease [Mycobacterium tilburgii]